MVSCNFNSIKVRLERVNARSFIATYEKDFNSIKVRLELVPTSANGSILIFQFHKGTIRTGTSRAADGRNRTFQFHKGTIRTVAVIGDQRTTFISIP